MPVLDLARHSTCAGNGASRPCRALVPPARPGGVAYPLLPVITSLRVDAVDTIRPMTIAISIVSLNLSRVYSILLTRTATVRPMQLRSSS